MKSKQQGITLVGFLFVLVLAGFFTYMAMQLVPAYFEFMGVKKMVAEVAAKPGEREKPLSVIRSDMSFKGDFQYVDNSTIREAQIRIDTGQGTPRLVFRYHKTIPFLYNIDFLLHFQTSAALNESSSGD